MPFRQVIHPDKVQGHIAKQFGDLYEPAILATLLRHATETAAEYFKKI